MSLSQMSVSGAVLIAVILAVRALTIHRLSKRVFVVLWSVALLRLLVPFSIPARVSVYSFVPEYPATWQAGEDHAGFAPAETDGTKEPQVLREAGEKETPKNAALPVRTLFRIAGTVVLAICFLICYVRSRIEFGMSLPVKNAFVTHWREEHRQFRTIQVRQSDRIQAPLTYGIFRPVILMPGRTDWNDRAELTCVLLHEYIHICRFDALWKLTATAALCVHWFNPMVWIMYVLFSRDMELSCDEAVVRRLGGDARSRYARALISMEEKKSGLLPLYNNFSRNAMEGRIKEIMRAKKITMGATIAGVMLIAAIAGMFATSAKADEAENIGRQEAGTADEGSAEGNDAASVTGDGSGEKSNAASVTGDGSGEKSNAASATGGDGSGASASAGDAASVGNASVGEHNTAQSAGDSERLMVYFIKSFDGKTVAADEAEWVQVRSARADELGIGDDDAPSGFYIYNEKVAVEELPVAEDCFCQILDWEAGYVPKEITLEEFGRVYAERMEMDIASDTENWLIFPWLLTVEDGEIVSIVEKYVP